MTARPPAPRLTDEQLAMLERMLWDPAEQGKPYPWYAVLPLVVELRELRAAAQAVKTLEVWHLDATAPPSAQELFIEPPWMAAARAWLADFRREVEAAGLEWVAPEIFANAETQWFWVWKPVKNGAEADARRLWFAGETAPTCDLPACVELYRRWLASCAEGGKPAGV